MKIVSWNMQNKRESWRFLVHPRHDEYDFAFIGEACVPPLGVRRSAVAAQWDIPYASWELQPSETRRKYRQEILSRSVAWQVERFERHEVVDAVTPSLPPRHDRIFRRWHRAAIARCGELELCLLCVVSGHHQAQSLPLLIGGLRNVLAAREFDPKMPMIVAGDLTTNRRKSPETFERMAEIGVPWVGPDAPNYIQIAGRKPHQRETPATAHRHLNHVFVTADLVDRVSVTALNDPDESSPSFWGPSDHCRIVVEVRDLD